MATIWIVLNFVLIILAFYLILHLYQNIRLLQKTSTEEIAKEIDAVFHVYLEDTRAENEKLIVALKQMLQENQTAVKRKPQRKKTKAPVNAAEKKATELQPEFKQMLDREIGQADTEQTSARENEHIAANDWFPPIDQINDTVEESPTLKAIKLQKQGLTPAEIAKKLGCGEGEVLLLLKMQEKGS